MKPTEKQKLLKRLNAFCGMLGDDLKSLDAGLVARIDDTIRRLGTTTKVAIAGLSDSQHGGVAEFLIGDSLFRNAEEKEKCPSIQIRYGKEAKTHAIFGDTHDTESIVWCSNATAPWQPKERRLWFTVPDTLKDRSILALTGAENVADDDARAALNEKRAFVAEDFLHHTPIFIDAAKDARSGGKVTDPAQYASSGGEALLNQIVELVQAKDAGLLEEARALRVELDKIPLGGSEPAPTVPLAPIAPVDQITAFVLEKATECKAAVAECKNNDYAPVFEPMTDLLTGIQKAVSGDLKLDRDQALMVTQATEATELVGLLSYENNDKAAQEAADITFQIVTDLWSRLPNDAAADTPDIAEIEKFSAAR